MGANNERKSPHDLVFSQGWKGHSSTWAGSITSQLHVPPGRPPGWDNRWVSVSYTEVKGNIYSAGCRNQTLVYQSAACHLITSVTTSIILWLYT